MAEKIKEIARKVKSMSRAMIQRLVNDDTDPEHDDEVLTSSYVFMILESFMISLTKTWNRSKIKLRIVQKGGDTTAYTTGDEILINENGPVMCTLKRSERFVFMLALLIHECAHILYTDFKISHKNMVTFRTTGGLYPEPEDTELYEKFKALGLSRSTATLLHDVWNILEDGNIEKAVQIANRGVVALIRLKNEKYFESSPSLDDAKNPIVAVETALMQRAVYHMDKGTASADYQPLLDEILPMADDIVAEDNPYIRYRTINELFCKVMVWISEYCEQQAENENNENGESDNSEQSDSDNSSETSEGSNGEGNKDGRSRMQEMIDEEVAKSNADGSRKHFDENMSSTHSVTYSGTRGESQKTSLDGMSKSGSDSKDENDENNDAGEASSMSESDTGTDENGENGENKDETLDNGDDSGSRADDISNVLEEIIRQAAKDSKDKAEGMVLADEAEQTRKELEDELNRDPESMHRNVRCEIVRADEDEAEYQHCMEDVRSLISRTDKEMRKAFSDIEIGERRRGLYMGNRFDAANAHRKDGACFENRKSKNDKPDLAIFILIDQSGSMCRNDKMKRAKEAALSVFVPCVKNGLAVSVYGHDESGSSVVQMHSCAEFYSTDIKGDARRIAGLQAECNNRDGYAIRFAAKRLKAVNAKSHLLLIISDGQPAADGYIGPEADKDVRCAVTEAIKDGISVITCGIGECAKQVKEVYRDTQPGERQKLARVLEVTDLSHLPKKFAHLVRQSLDLD